MTKYTTNNWKESEQPIYKDGKLYGVIRDGSLLDIRKHDDHFVYMRDALGNLQLAVCISTYTLRKGRKANIIQVTNLEKKIKFTISRRDFDRRSIDFQGSRVSVDEEQRACFLKYFASDEPPHRNYPQHIEAEPLQAQTRQGWKNLDLFSR